MHTSWIRAPVVTSLLGDPAASETAVPLDFFVGQLEASRNASANPLALWSLGEAIDLRSLGCLGEAVLNSPTLGKALRIFAQGFSVIQSNTQVQTLIDGNETHVTYRVLDPHIWPRRADAELSLGLIRGICAAFGLPRDALRALGFEHQQDSDARPLAQHAGCALSFGHEENRLTLPTQALSQRRSPDPTPEAERQSLKMLESALTEQRRSAPTSQRVRHIVLGQLGRSDVSQQAIALALGMSERSLRRALALEGRPFHEILEECRRAQGFALLIHSDRPLSEIALALGYSDQTAFSRAFSRWFGLSPLEIRRNGAIEESVIR